MDIDCKTEFLYFFTRSRLLLLLLVLSLTALTSSNLHKSFASSAATFTASNTNDSGTGSLRQAILDANANPGTDTIVFNIAPGGVQTISPVTVLPTITDPVIIDGTTQPGFSGTPLIVIDGSNLTISNVYGLRIDAGNSTVRALVINNCLSSGAIGLANGGGNTIQGNYIGTDATGMVRRANYAGITIFSSSSNNLIGGTSPSQRNVISGGGFENIAVINGVGNQIKGNFIGTNAQGTASIGNGGYGVDNEGGQGAVIGGTEPGAGNLISGNGQSGIYLGGTNATVQGNFIGTDVTGTQSIPNTSSGIYVSGGGGALIGGTTAAARNVISGNSSGITYSSFGNPAGKIQGNYIGTDVTGMVAIPNGWGVFVNEPVVIGGSEAGAGNLISGNTFDGIRIDDSNSLVQGNLIGTDATGLRKLENNPQAGIRIQDFENIIGGNQPGAGNIISGNTIGIQVGGLSSSPPSDNKIQGNFIGTDRSANYPIPNTNGGIVISDGVNNIIGGTNAGEQNVIAYNNRKGIFVSGSSGLTTGNQVRRNSIFLNSELGIDLGTQGVRINDPCDPDTGANNLQNYPMISSAVSNGTTTAIAGSLNSTASTTFAIDFFTSPTYDSTNFGEGKTYVGSTNVTTAANCNVNFDVALPYPAAGGQFITATATDSNGNTSEFSQYVRAGGTSIRANFDYDADGKSDVSVFRPSTGAWYLQRSTAGFQGLQFGADGDKLTPADFDGDGKTDIAVYRPSAGQWYVLNSATGTVSYPVFGVAEDVPAPGDYDGDGKADLAVFRPSQGTWYRQNSSNGSFFGFQFGATGDVPTVGDFDGDGKNDLGIWRPSNGDWYHIRSSNGSVFGERFGQTGDKIAPADYDGDGKTDIAIFRPSTGLWVLRNSATATYSYSVFGSPTDIPISGDYDGDGKADIGVWRPSNGTWYVQRSSNGSFIVFPWGQNGDRPTPAAFGN